MDVLSTSHIFTASLASIRGSYCLAVVCLLDQFKKVHRTMAGRPRSGQLGTWRHLDEAAIFKIQSFQNISLHDHCCNFHPDFCFHVSNYATTVDIWLGAATVLSQLEPSARSLKGWSWPMHRPLFHQKWLVLYLPTLCFCIFDSSQRPMVVINQIDFHLLGWESGVTWSRPLGSPLYIPENAERRWFITMSFMLQPELWEWNMIDIEIIRNI